MLVLLLGETLWRAGQVWLISKSLAECLAHENYLTNICWILKWDSKTIYRCEQIQSLLPGKLLPREGSGAFRREVANQIWPSHLVVFCYVNFSNKTCFPVLETKVSQNDYSICNFSSTFLHGNKETEWHRQLYPFDDKLYGLFSHSWPDLTTCGLCLSSVGVGTL